MHPLRRPLRRSITSILIVVALTGCAAPSTKHADYNRGVEAYRSKNYAAARLHWTRAIDHGELSALNNLGYLLYNGLGGPADQDRAVSLWRKAAMGGHSESQKHLGYAYEDGTAVPENLVEAYAWYRCAITSAEAAADDNEKERKVEVDARLFLTRLLPKLTADQFAAGEVLAKRYIQSYVIAEPTS